MGQNIIVAGGGGVGCETAEYLATLGKKVTIVEMLQDVATGLPSKRRYFTKRRLGEGKVRIRTGSEIQEVTEKGVVVLDKESGKRVELEGTVVLALGAIPNNELIPKLRGRVRELYAIGDCVHPRRILEAIHEASFVSRQI